MSAMAAETPWTGGRLVFGRMFEDWLLEEEVLPAEGRILCIASGGGTAFALAARGRSVTAVDVNPAQVEELRRRLAGAPPRRGAVDHMLARLRLAGPLVGWTPARMRAFCDLADPAAQRRLWTERLDTRRFRAALALLLHPAALRTVYAPALVRVLPPRFDRAIRARLARGFARHPNRDNPYARSLLLGEAPEPPPPGLRLELACAEVAAYLDGCAPRSFDGFSLSNVLDGPGSDYAERLLHAVRRAAAPGAVLVLRSFGEPRTDAEDEWAARDRALLWGSIRVEEIG